MNYSNADNGYDSKGVYDNKKNSDSPMSVQSAAYENGGTSNTSATYKSDTTSRNKAYLKLVYEQYKKYKLSNKKLDFDDMIIYCHKCLSRNQRELEYWQGVFDYVCVDEFQDTGLLQADIIYMVADTKKNVCVVGDDDQSIYGFRGASGTVFMDFMKRFPDAKKIILGTNYRSLPYIIKGADKVVSNNQVRIKKDMKAYRSGDGRIHIREAATQGRHCLLYTSPSPRD